MERPAIRLRRVAPRHLVRSKWTYHDMTPGPWISIKDDDGWHILHEGKEVTDCEANAHACGAVPEMRAALEAVEDWSRKSPLPARLSKQINAALNLAQTGRGATWQK